MICILSACHNIEEYCRMCEEVRNVESVMCHVIRLVVEVVERERRF